MAKVAPYHTVEPELPPERNVYHDHSDCPTGRRIEPRHLRSGTAWPPSLQGLHQTRLTSGVRRLATF